MGNESGLRDLTRSEKIDLLDRQEFVDRVISVANALSENKKNACYAINGGWGVGKTYVLDVIEEQLRIIHQEETTLPRYLVFRYDCWEYDYYEEPVIAIVATLLDWLDKNVHLIPRKTKEKAQEIIKQVALTMGKSALKIVDEKLGGIVSDIGEAVCEGAFSETHNDDKKYIYDKYIDFRDTLKNLRESLLALSEEQTIVFMVDELDRCLPEYTIKVLERLHHIFNGIPNVQIVISVDKNQLNHTIRRIFGDETNTDRYLAKFIDFEFLLTEGTINDEYRSLFAEYMQLFTGYALQINESDVDEFIKLIFEGMEVRTRKSTIEKCKLIHNLVSDRENLMSYDKCTMCAEILLTIIHHSNLDSEKALKYSQNSTSILSVFAKQHFSSEKVPVGLELLNEKLKHNKLPNSSYKYLDIDTHHNRVIIQPIDLWAVLLGVYRLSLGADDNWYSVYPPKFSYEDLKKHVNAFSELIQVIN